MIRHRQFSDSGLRGLKGLLLAGALALFASSASAADTTYYWTNTVANAFATAYDWDDPGNWKNGQVPSGNTCIVDFQVGSNANWIYIRMPDDHTVDVGKLQFNANNIKCWFYGGKGFRCTRNDGTAFIMALGGGSGTPDNVRVFTPVHCDHVQFQPGGIRLACPITFGFTGRDQLNVSLRSRHRSQ